MLKKTILGRIIQIVILFTFVVVHQSLLNAAAYTGPTGSSVVSTFSGGGSSSSESGGGGGSSSGGGGSQSGSSSSSGSSGSQSGSSSGQPSGTPNYSGPTSGPSSGSSSSSSSSSESNQESSEDSGEEEKSEEELKQEKEDELNEKAAPLEASLNERKETNDKVIVCDDTSSESQGKANDISGSEANALTAESVAEEKAKEDVKIITDKKNTANSQKGGDPVLLTEGSYEQNETDISKSNIIALEIKRRYSSSSVITSSFGYGWTTNLDQRIILGTQARPYETEKSLENQGDNISSAISAMEALIIRAYKVSSLANAENELKARIENCKTNYNKTHELYNSLAALEDEAEGYDAKENITKLKESAASLETSINQNKTRAENYLAKYRADIQKLESFKSRKNNAAANLAAYRKLLEITKSRKARNSLGMFPGMGLEYEETGLNSLTVIDEDGFPHLLYETANGSGVWNSSSENKIIECISAGNGQLILRERDGTNKTFDSRGFLIRLTDRNGNFISIERDSNEKITKISNSAGESFTVSYSGSYISKITNVRLESKNITYSYNGNKLTKVKDSEGDSVSMAYDSAGHMTRLTKSDGSSIIFSYGEVSSDGKLLTSSTTNEEGYSEKFIYDRSKRRTDYIDHDGNMSRYWYDEKYRTVREEGADGSIIKKEYDDNGNLSLLDENNFITRYSYDSKGNMISATYGDGSYERWTYDSYNLIKSYTNRDNILEEYLRDSKGNLLQYKRGGKTVYTQEINSQGLVTKKTVYASVPVITSYTYDSFGNLTGENTSGIQRKYEYDKLNRLTKESRNGKVMSQYSYDGRNITRQDYNGLKTSWICNSRKDITKIIQTDMQTGIIHQTRIEYDKRHLPLRVYSGDGNTEELIESYLYTAEGKLCVDIKHGEKSWLRIYDYKNGRINLIRQFSCTGLADNNKLDWQKVSSLANQAGENIISQSYDYRKKSGKGSLMTITDSLGISLQFEYNSNGYLINSVNGIGEKLNYSFSSGGKALREQDICGGYYFYSYNSEGLLYKIGEEGGPYVQASYNADGRISSQTDRLGVTTYYSYDSIGRLTSIQNSKKKVWYEYDNFNRLTAKITGSSPNKNAATYFVTYSYSDDGRKIIKTEGDKYITIADVDAFGNTVKVTDGNTNERSYVYNHLNLMMESYDGYKNKTSYEYNALDMLSKLTLPDGSQTLYEYNYMGQLVKITDDCGLLYSASYDKGGRLVSEKSRAEAEKSYEYDNAGRIIKYKSGDKITETHRYTSNGRSRTVKDGKENNYLYYYDSFGRLTSEINRKAFTKEYSYDAEGNLISDSSRDGLFTYDELGNILEAKNADCQLKYLYDKGGKLIYLNDLSAGEEIYYEYDEGGNRTHIKSSNRDTFYVYGKNNEVKEIFDNKQKLSIKLKYNNIGKEVLRTFGNGVKEEYLYDKAGRLIVKMQKSQRGELLWGEAYVYAADGKRIASVDNQTRVTFYEYNSCGQLSSVFYPYSEELIKNLKTEAERNGLPLNAEAGENRFLTSEEKAALIPLLNSMEYGLSYSLSSLQIFIKESYTYDENGNRASRKTPYGNIEYTYDAENCLLSSGSHGQAFVRYEYDQSGNLISEESALQSKKYEYNENNRLIYCETRDKETKSYYHTSYAYDAFERRILIEDIDEKPIRTVYDGFTFDILKQGDSPASRYSNTGRPTGDRYRYLGSQKQKDDSRYVYLDENTYKAADSRYRGERSCFTVNGSLAAQVASDYGVEYFSNDLLGSVRAASDNKGQQTALYSYDVFGAVLEGSLDGRQEFGYLGKSFDSVTGFYNYGFRDYNPAAARFTTIDPIRDGNNWFTYCNGDPVNFIDLWGLKITNFFAYSSMSNYEGIHINETKSTINSSGCAMTGMANIITEAMHILHNNQRVYDDTSHDGFVETITPETLNISSNFHGKTDCLNWNAAASDYGLSAERSKDKKDAQTMIKNAGKSNEQEFALIQVPITIGEGKNKETIYHWVGHSGNTIKEKGTTWVEIVATSNNDAGRDAKNSNWIQRNGKMYVKQSAIEGAVVVKNKTK